MRRFSPELLTRMRLREGLSREFVAVQTGKSYATIRSYERGGVTPPTLVLERLAELFDCDPGDFFTDSIGEPV